MVRLIAKPGRLGLVVCNAVGVSVGVDRCVSTLSMTAALVTSWPDWRAWVSFGALRWTAVVDVSFGDFRCRCGNC